MDDEEPKYGLSVVGVVEPGKEVTTAGAKAGDKLVLTKALGTGIITTAGKQGTAPADVFQGAVATMATLNKQAADAMTKVGVNACTDITGFGLMGHLMSMVRSSRVGARIEYSKVPLLPGAWDLLVQGIVPGGTHRNLQAVSDAAQWHPELTDQQQLLLCDAQTSGGLLMSVPGDKVDKLVSELQASGVSTAEVIGEITEGADGIIEVVP